MTPPPNENQSPLPAGNLPRGAKILGLTGLLLLAAAVIAAILTLVFYF